MKTSRLLFLAIAQLLFISSIIAQYDEDADLDELPNLIVVDFDSSEDRYVSRELPGKISEMIQDGMISTGLFNLLEREKLDSILQEQGWTNSGMVDPSQAIQMGKMMGADYILTGKIISVDSEEKRFSGYGVNTTTTIATLRAKAQIVDLTKGQIVFSKSCKAQTTIYEAGGLRNASTGTYVELAEQIANEIVIDVRRSKKFKKTNDAPEMVTVNLTSIPEMADVEVDGVFFGNASGEMQLPAGMHTLKVSIPGYTVWEKKVMVSQNLKILARLREETE